MYLGNCQIKLHYSLFKIFEIQKGRTFSCNDILRLDSMYNITQYCHTNSRLNKEKLTVGRGNIISTVHYINRGV